jgi:5S rRNA maturation endonuclease (ribonuclease M5)/KaiC/GvpD/RAD55 family RecA-like ATPase
MTTATLDTARMSKEALLNEIAMAGGQIKGTAILCPFHDDHSPSAGVYEKDGVWRFKCNAASCGFCGDIYDVRAKMLGKPVEEILKAAHPSQQPAKQVKVFTWQELLNTLPGKFEAGYEYRNPTTGNLDLYVIRFRDKDGKKGFRQITVAGQDRYYQQAPPKPWPIYNRAEIVKAQTVVVVEGEKCVEALRPFGIVATTNPCGAGKAEHCDWSLLKGKEVILWPDNDEGGKKHIQQVGQILESLNCRISEIEPTDLDLREKEDAADFVQQAIAAYETEQERYAVVYEALSRARTKGASNDVADLIEDTISGKRRSLEWPWSRLTKLTNALLPGTVSLVCGDPGSTKSFLLIEALTFWFLAGLKVACYELEEDRTYHLNRALAQIANNGNLFDADWIKENPNEARAAAKQHSKLLDGLGRCIWAAPEKQTTLEELAEWVRARAKDGCRIIVIDPITAAEPENKPWISDSKFMMAAKNAVRDYGASLILATHPKKGRKGAIGLDELSGGAAYQRFSQTIVWVERHDKKTEKKIRTDLGTIKTSINRTIHLSKTRNGKGHGLALGFNFDGDTLRFAEQGIIIAEVKNDE